MNIELEMETKLIDLAIKSIPFEMCGVLYRKDGTVCFKEIANVHPKPREFFTMSPIQLSKMRRTEGVEILAYVHSHPEGTSAPSAMDEAQCKVSGKPYVIVGTKDRTVRVVLPNGSPLIGREYVHGVQDCYTLVQDYYARELGIGLPDFERTDKWWEDAESSSLYTENFKDAGFVEVSKDDIQKHDVIICYWGHTAHPNHAIVWLGENPKLLSEDHTEIVGTRLYLHHPYNNKSTVCILGDSRLNTVAYVLRHKSKLTYDDTDTGGSIS